MDGALAGLDRYGLVDAVDVDGVASVVLHPVVRASAAALLAATTEVTPWRRAVDAALTALADECVAAERAGWDVARVGPDHPDTVKSRRHLAFAEAALRRRPWLRLRRPRPTDCVDRTPAG